MSDSTPMQVPASESTCALPADVDHLALAPIEHFLLRNDLPEHPMVFRVLMKYDGPFHREHLTTAFDLAIRRQPLLRSLAVAEPDGVYWKLTDNIPTLQWETSELSPSQLSLTPIPPIDLTRQPGVLCRVYPSESGLVILLDVHHVCCDGQGARQFLSEWFGHYQNLVENRLPVFSTLNYDQLKDRHRYRFPKPPIGTFEGLRNLYLTIRGRTIRLPERSPQSTAPDMLFERTFSVAETSALRANLKQKGATINDAGVTASFLALVDSFPAETRRGYISLMHPVDLRWPSDLRTPACNRVGVTFLRRKQNDCLQPKKLFASLQDQMNYIKQRYVGAEFLRGLAASKSLPGGSDRIQSWGWFLPTLQFTCLGDTTRALHYRFNQVDGAINFSGLQLERISGFMQLGPFLPISLAACETNQRLSLTARASTRHFTENEAQRFLDRFAENILRLGALS